MLTFSNSQRIEGSFRDPSGFLFCSDGILYRQINIEYRDHYDHLISSGLYDALTNVGLLIPHQELSNRHLEHDIKAYKVIQPEKVPFISYPYEWCFSQLKDAALVTLGIQKIALNFGMCLKDASAYNMQFKDGKPILIDTLSFEKYREGSPWIAYRQFCQHFLAPLALMAFTDVRLGQLLRVYVDGVPLDLASILLPRFSWFKLSLLLHIHLHSRTQKHFADKKVNIKSHAINKKSFLNIIDGLESSLQKLSWRPSKTEWVDYYKDTNYSGEAFDHKKQVIQRYLADLNPKSVWDMGANTGLFSRLAVERGIQTVAFDSDPAAVEQNYRTAVENKEDNILPLYVDLTNPSPGIGWENQERMSLHDRGPVDLAFALALIHHLVISNNLPLIKIATFFSRLCRYLIIEFVPKSDSQVQKLLITKMDTYNEYTKADFERAFSGFYSIESVDQIRNSERVLYLMKKKQVFV